MRVAFKTEDRFPLETYCQVNKEIIDTQDHRSVEISRLCIAKEMRQHDEADNYDRKNSERNITWGLVRASAEFSLKNNIHHWYMLTTKGLARMFIKKGIVLEKRSESCNLKGERFVFEMSPAQIITCPFYQTDFKNSYRLYSDLKLGRTENTVNALTTEASEDNILENEVEFGLA